MSKTEEGILKEQSVSLLRKSGFYVRIIAIGIIPGRTNPSKGIADTVAIKNGRVYMLEFKSKKGSLSKEQKDFLLQWCGKGGEAHIIRSIEQIINIIKNCSYGASRRGIIK